MGMQDAELEQVRRLLAQVSYRDWTLVVNVNRYNVANMQVCTMVPDTETGNPIENRGRPLPLCPQMSDGFILDLVFELIKEFELHEAAERFSVAGKRLFHPHQPDGVPLFEVPAMRRAPSSLSPSAPVKEDDAGSAGTEQRGAS
ncbi:hypothetical protein D7X32_37560 [Corallococcus carmarthensis]|uniref:Uncharacterized protein n=2 Tax=Corallococcus carmarthensis TaxID=2316728 RepID=A0A3A8K2H1_9BACT|nr:hypothetical protein D7X32_37560 [Corallococcus carmarthensis]